MVESDNTSFFVFRLDREWFALTAKCFTKVLPPRRIHLIPHRSGIILRGLVNVDGELKLAVDFHALLQINSASPLSQAGRMAAIEWKEQTWVFFTDEVIGIFRKDKLGIENMPADAAVPFLSGFLKGIAHLENKGIWVLDEKLIFSALKGILE
jgi:chemotaxis-related protein WspD